MSWEPDLAKYIRKTFLIMNVFMKEQAPHRARMIPLQFKQLEVVVGMSDQVTLVLPSLDSIISIIVKQQLLSFE